MNFKRPIPTYDLKSDNLDRKGEVELLTSLITNSTDSYVLAIDGDWGVGKTWMLKAIQENLLDKSAGKAVVIYHNAWENDFSVDPLLALVADLDKQLKNNSNYSSTDQVTSKLKALSLSVAPVVAKKIAVGLITTAAKMIVGAEATKAVVGALQSVNSELEVSEENAASIGEAAGDAAEKHVENVVAKHQEKLRHIETFKGRLKELTSAISERQVDGKQFPVVMIIDELDRCRPNYAIELLERIKHLFDVPNMVFLLGIARTELQHSIQAVYGQNFDAHAYLHRFIDLDYRLPSRVNERFVRNTLDNLSESEREEAAPDFVWFAQVYMMTARDMSQVLARYAVLVVTNRSQGNGWKSKILRGYVRYLLCVRHKNVVGEAVAADPNSSQDESMVFHRAMNERGFRFIDKVDSDKIFAGILSKRMRGQCAGDQVDAAQRNEPNLIAVRQHLDKYAHVCGSGAAILSNEAERLVEMAQAFS